MRVAEQRAQVHLTQSRVLTAGRLSLSLSLHLVERGGVAVGVLDAVLDLASSLAHLLRDVEDTAHIEATRAAVGHLPLDHCTTA